MRASSAEFGPFGDPSGCHWLAEFYAEGKGVKQDIFKAVELYQESCDGGYGGDSNNLGVMYSRGEGVSQDEVQVLKYFGKACDLKS